VQVWRDFNVQASCGVLGGSGVAEIAFVAAMEVGKVLIADT